MSSKFNWLDETTKRQVKCLAIIGRGIASLNIDHLEDMILECGAAMKEDTLQSIFSHDNPAVEMKRKELFDVKMNLLKNYIKAREDMARIDTIAAELKELCGDENLFHRLFI